MSFSRGTGQTCRSIHPLILRVDARPGGSQGGAGAGGRSLSSARYISGLRPVVCQAHRLARADPEQKRRRDTRASPNWHRLQVNSSRVDPSRLLSSPRSHGLALLRHRQQQLRLLPAQRRRGVPRPALRVPAARAAAEEAAASRPRAQRRHGAGGEEEPAPESQRPRA